MPQAFPEPVSAVVLVIAVAEEISKYITEKLQQQVTTEPVLEADIQIKIMLEAEEI